MKVLFLDIDGVLNSHRSCLALGGFPYGVEGYNRDQFDEVAVRLVRHIVKVAGASIVLSSSWRILHDYEDIARGLELPIIDCTPRLAGSRGSEIAAWLAQHPEVETYAIVDDDSDMLDGQVHRFVKTNMDNGLMWDDASLLAEILGVSIYAEGFDEN